MPRLRPIQAIRYAGGGDVSPRIAPPYDVLDEAPKRALLARDANNIVAVDLPVTPPKTVGPDEAYEQAGDRFRRWLDDGVLVRDEAPAVYAYEQACTVDGKAFKRRGLFAGLGVEAFNQPHGIFRHEMTFKSGTDDRLKLMEATATQMSPIFGVYRDPQQHVASILGDVYDRQPDFHGTTDNDGVEHRCWIVNDSALVEALSAHFASTEVFIADGHHRYTTALNYSKAHPDNAAASACLFVLVAAEDPGMIVRPTHRAITGLVDFSIEAFIEAAARTPGLVLRASGAAGLAELEAQLPAAGHHAMGIVDSADSKRFVLTTEQADPLEPTHGARPAVWRTLDVAVLHELVIDRVLRPNFGGDGIAFKYTADLNDLVSLLGGADDRLGAVVQPTPLESVCRVSLANDVMPQKSTFFYPKLATGLVISPLWD